MMIKKQSTKATNRGLVLLVLLTMSVVFLCSCNKSQSNSSSSSEQINTRETTDDQNRKIDSNSASTDQGEIEIYAGPGLDYYCEGKIDYTGISGFVLEDHGWIEIKYNNSQHGYVKSDFVEKEDLSKVPVLIDTIPTTVGGRKYLETADFQYRLSGDIDLFEDTDALNKTSMIEKGNVVTVVAPMPLKGNEYQIVGVKGGTEQERSYWLIDAYTERGKERAYVGARDLFDLDNPLKDFSSVKENNLKLSLGDDVYYSSGDSDFFKDEWETIDEFNLTHTEVNYWEGFLSVITSSDISLEDIESPVVEGFKTKIPTLSKGKRTYTNTYTSLEEVGPISPTQLNALVWLGEKLLTFLSESKQTQSFSVSLQQCRGEKRLVIYTGVPIESMQNGRYYGKKFSLLELLLDKGYTLLTATDVVDENIRSLDPAFDGEKKYSMDIEFAKQGKDDSPYGMRIIIDKEGNAYGNIVLNQGTYFRVVYDNKVVRDLTKDIESALFQLDNKTTSILLDLLEQSGFEIIKRESVGTKEEKSEVATYDNSEISDEALEQYLYNMEIPVEIYTFFYHFSDSKEVNVNDPYTFWMMLSIYATMQMDDEMYPSGSRLAERYRDEKYGQMLILSEEEVRDAVNAMMPGITEYPPFPDIEYEKPYKKDGNYYFSLIDLDAVQAARMIDIEINDDGTATAIVEAYSHSYSGNYDNVLETYQLNLTRNDKINLDSPEPYPFCIESIKAFDSSEPELNEAENVHPYSTIIDALENEYGSLTIRIIDEPYQQGGEQAVEANGLCYLNLVDFTNDGSDELMAVCKKEKEEHYTGFIYIINNGEAELIYENDQIEYNALRTYDEISLSFTDDSGYVLQTGWSAASGDAEDRVFYWYDGNGFSQVYRSEGYWDNSQQKAVMEENVNIIDLYDDQHRDQLLENMLGVCVRATSDVFFDENMLRYLISVVKNRVEDKSEEEIINYTDSYEGIAEQYQRILANTYDDEDLFYEMQLLKLRYPYLNTELIYDAFMNEYGLNYWLYDIDQNGAMELCISSDYSEEINGYFYALYTQKDNQVFPLITNCVYRTMFYVCEDGSIIEYSSTGAMTGNAIVYKMSDSGDKLVLNDEYDIDYEYYPNAPYFNGKERLTKEEFDTKHQMVDPSVFILNKIE